MGSVSQAQGEILRGPMSESVGNGGGERSRRRSARIGRGRAGVGVRSLIPMWPEAMGTARGLGTLLAEQCHTAERPGVGRLSEIRGSLAYPDVSRCSSGLRPSKTFRAQRRDGSLGWGHPSLALRAR